MISEIGISVHSLNKKDLLFTINISWTLYLKAQTLQLKYIRENAQYDLPLNAMMKCTVNIKLYTVTENLSSLTVTVWRSDQSDLWLNVKTWWY